LVRSTVVSELAKSGDLQRTTEQDLVEQIHSSFLETGCDVIETFTFQGSRLKLDEYRLGEQTHAINFAAAQIARRVADRFTTPGRPRFVAGSIGPSGMLPSTDDPALGAIGFDELAAVFYEQSRALIEGGVDLLVIETQQDLLETKAAIAGARRACRDTGRSAPVQAQVSLLDTSGTLLLAADFRAVLVTPPALHVDVVGLNCSTGPELMRDALQESLEAGGIGRPRDPLHLVGHRVIMGWRVRGVDLPAVGGACVDEDAV